MKLNLTREEFEQLYYEKTNEELCQILGISSNTLWRWKHQLNLCPKKKGRPRLQLQFKESDDE